MKSAEFYKNVGKCRKLAEELLMVDVLSDTWKGEYVRYESDPESPALFYDPKSDSVEQVGDDEKEVDVPIVLQLDDELLDGAFVKLFDRASQQCYDDVESTLESFYEVLKRVLFDMECRSQVRVDNMLMNPETFLKLFEDGNLKNCDCDPVEEAPVVIYNYIGDFFFLKLFVSDLIPIDKVFLSLGPEYTGIVCHRKNNKGIATVCGGRSVGVIRIKA